MKKLFISATLFLLLSAGYTHAQTQPVQTASQFCTGGSCTYVPLEPIPGLPSSYGPNKGSIASFINDGFKLLIGAGALIAIIMIVLGALTYMFSDIAGNKKNALSRIRNAMWAIVILVSSYLILFTINPELVTLTFNLGTSGNPNSPTAAPSGTRTSATPVNTITTGAVNAGVQQAVCGNADSCRTWGEYMVFDPKSTSLDVQLARDRFISNCETTHPDSQNIYSTRQGKVALFSAGTVGSSGLTGAACVLQ